MDSWHGNWEWRKENKVVLYNLEGLEGTAAACVLFVEKSYRLKLVIAFVYSIC